MYRKLPQQINDPSLSIIIPTLNSQRVLDICLASIYKQQYSGKIEIIIADGGSVDNTLSIARQYNTKIIKNKLKTGEAGKAIGVKYAKGDILVFIDSDNVLPNDKWLKIMTRPFTQESMIIASEPLYFNYNKHDHWLTRYFALLGMGDPLNLFIGNYDRYSYISNKWTEMSIKVEKKEKYLILLLDDQIPTIGANGFMVRKKELKKYPIKDYLFDIDVLKFLAKDQNIKVAKVKIGITHLFSGTIATFIRKQKRRIRDYLYFQNTGIRIKEDNKYRIYKGIIKFTFSTILILPILYQTIIGYLRKKDFAWFFHPIACWVTLVIYGWEAVRALFIRQEFDRKKWSQ